MLTEIINVGDELLLGDTLNKNVQVISKILLPLGVKTSFTTMVGDDRENIISTFKIALNRSDLIIFTGGLGPTHDDFTKEVISDVLEKELILNKDLLKIIEKFFKSRDIEMTENNIKQAYVPKDSIVLENKNGTAPGFFINYLNKKIVLLPGPPREVEPMFKEYVVPLLKLNNNSIITKTINTVGIGESKLETIINEIITYYSFIGIATYARVGLVDIRLTANLEDKKMTNDILEEVCEKLNIKLKEYIYSYNNKKIEQVVFELLEKNDLKIGFCESCTGGLVTSKITNLDGASKVLDRSIVTYSNDSKMEEVFVKKETLEKFGAVSRETAVEMARGLFERKNIDIAVSITGLAGPKGEENKPVGLIYICLVAHDREIIIENIFKGNRIYIQERASIEVFDLIRKHLLTEV